MTIAPCGTHHLKEDIPLYAKRFRSVLKYAGPGLAAVVDETGAYHIDEQGEAAYKERFLRTFGFYCGLAAVTSSKGWFHITPQGKPAYKETYQFCGNFQENRCVVKSDQFFHIDLTGKPLYKERYAYAGDFRDGIAAVTNHAGLQTHINAKGEHIHNQWYNLIDVYHKGYARAQDHRGWLHINQQGHPIYTQRYKNLEPFYNGVAFAETFDGAYLLIDEQGNVVETIKEGSYLPNLSREMVGFWTSFTLYKAVQGDILESDEKLLRALWEMDIVMPDKEGWKLTEKGELLDTPSMRAAAKMWIDDHLPYWQNTKSSNDYFEELNAVENYHLAMQAYAAHDYPNIPHLIPWENHKTVMDLGGSTGTLLLHLLKAHPHLQGILFDRPEVVKELTLPPSISVIGGSFFDPIPVQADAIIMSRILHDWDDQKALQILKRAKAALMPNGTLYIVEMMRFENRPDGALLDLHMSITTGGKERSRQEWDRLIKNAGLDINNITELNPILSIVECR